MQEAQQREVPLLLATVKGYTGHQESAAGTVGLMEAVQLAQHAAVAPALHLGHLNPYTHAALDKNRVSIGRGGPFGASSNQIDGKLLLGVSSFGAQGTNAHVLVHGSGNPRVLPTSSSMPWNLVRCWVAPNVQSLLATAWVRKRTKPYQVALIFECNLTAARSYELWEYKVNGSVLLPASSLVCITASAVALLGAGSGSFGTLLGITMPAPLALPIIGLGPLGTLAVATLAVRPAAATAEITFQQQKVLTSKLGCTREAAPQTTSGLELLPSELQYDAVRPAASQAAQLEASPLVSKFAGMPAAALVGHAIYPTYLEAIISQNGICVRSWISPASWLRSISAVVFPLCGSTIPVPEYDVGCITYRYEQDGWAIGSSYMGAPSHGAGTLLHLSEVVLGEQDLPPTSPGPSSLTPFEIKDVGKGEAIGEEGPVSLEHPLLYMSEDERLLHLQAQASYGAQPSIFLVSFFFAIWSLFTDFGVYLIRGDL